MADDKREFEGRMFSGFLDAAPDFRATIRGEWRQPDDDPPDVMFEDMEGRRVGVELKAWLNEEQIATAKRREAIERGILEAIGKQPPNEGKVISYVWLSPCSGKTPSKDEAGAFQNELLSLLKDCDDDRRARQDKMVQQESVTDFGRRSTLARYLDGVTLFPFSAIDPGKQDWIGFPFRGGAYSEKDMLAPLQDLISATWEKYRTLKEDKGFQRLVLLIHYDARAFQYNSPISAPDWDIGLFAEELASYHDIFEAFGEKTSQWDEIYLFDAVTKKALLVHPLGAGRSGSRAATGPATGPTE